MAWQSPITLSLNLETIQIILPSIKLYRQLKTKVLLTLMRNNSKWAKLWVNEITQRLQQQQKLVSCLNFKLALLLIKIHGLLANRSQQNLSKPRQIAHFQDIKRRNQLQTRTFLSKILNFKKMRCLKWMESQYQDQ